MVIASPYSILVYTDHEALKVLLTGIDNDAHGRIAKWQERLGEYNFSLIHRTASAHFMGIADGLSRLPSALMQQAFIEDSDGPQPRWATVIASGQHGIDVQVPATAIFATKTRLEIGLTKGKREIWQNGEYHGGDGGEDARKGGGDGVGVVGVVLREQDEGWRLEMAAKAMKRRKWQRWLNSGYYGQVVKLKMEGMRAVEEFKLDLGKGGLRALENKAKRYRMSEGQEARLYWQESDGQLAACVLEEEVERVLMNLHDGHGHFAAGITGGRAQGQFFWPTRQKDIGQWVSSCRPCQRMTKIEKSGQLRPILQFGPMDMVGMDFIGPINPPCEATGAVYILLVVDYFSRFTFGTALQKADQQATMQFIVDKVVPIVGWPKSVYSDNGSHFTGNAIRQMWKDHGVLQFTAAISHPQSVGLSERYVQMTMGRIRLCCIEMGSSRDWGLFLKDALIDINTRCVRVHGYTPSQIYLGFNAKTSQEPVLGTSTAVAFNEDGNWVRGSEIPTAEEDTIHVYMDRRDEQNFTAIRRVARSRDHIRSKASPGYRQPKVGDLVLVRDIQLAKEKGKKLEPRWSTPRILERMSKSGISGHVRQLHDPPGKTKRYHLDDLIPYTSRTGKHVPANAVLPAIEYTRDALGNVLGSWVVGQRAFDLGDLRGREGNGWEEMRK